MPCKICLNLFAVLKFMKFLLKIIALASTQPTLPHVLRDRGHGQLTDRRHQRAVVSITTSADGVRADGGLQRPLNFQQQPISQFDSGIVSSFVSSVFQTGS